MQLLVEPDESQRDGVGRVELVCRNHNGGCAWTSSGVPAWITGVPASGTGTTTINFTVAANSDPTPRSANIMIGGQTFAVTQAAARVQLLVESDESQRDGVGRVELVCRHHNGGVCVDEQRRAGVDYGRAGERDGDDDDQFHRRRQYPIPRRAQPTSSSAVRRSSVSQAAAACSFSLNPTSHTATASGGSSSFDRRHNTGCVRLDEQRRAGVDYGRAGERHRHDDDQFHRRRQYPIPRRAAANITIGGQTFSVSQAAAACSFSLNPDEPQRDGIGRVELVQHRHNTGCVRLDEQRRADVDYRRAGERNRHDDDQFHRRRQYPAPPRTANIIIGGQTFSVSQAPGAPTMPRLDR